MLCLFWVSEEEVCWSQWFVSLECRTAFERSTIKVRLHVGESSKLVRRRRRHEAWSDALRCCHIDDCPRYRLEKRFVVVVKTFVAVDISKIVIAEG